MKCYKDRFPACYEYRTIPADLQLVARVTNMVFCRSALRTLSSSLLRNTTAPLAGHAAFAPSSPLRSTDDTLGSRTLLKLRGFLPAGVQTRRLAYNSFTSIFYFYSCATGSTHNQAQTRGDSTSTQEAEATCIR